MSISAFRSCSWTLKIALSDTEYGTDRMNTVAHVVHRDGEHCMPLLVYLFWFSQQELWCTFIWKVGCQKTRKLPVSSSLNSRYDRQLCYSHGVVCEYPRKNLTSFYLQPLKSDYVLMMEPYVYFPAFESLIDLAMIKVQERLLFGLYHTDHPQYPTSESTWCVWWTDGTACEMERGKCSTAVYRAVIVPQFCECAKRRGFNFVPSMIIFVCSITLAV